MSAALAPPTVGSAPIRAPTPRLKQATVSGPEAGAPAAARRPAHPGQSDPLSDRATSLLIRRTLCPQQLGDQNRDVQVPIEDLLPPLTSRNDVDLQLYAFLAIILREFVQSWYSKITTDESFVGEVLHVVAHCTRALEQRLRKVDLESLVLDEIPDLLDKHITAYRAAHRPVSQPPVEVDPREVYHSLFPLPSLTPVPRPDDPDTILEQRENEAAYRQLLVQAALAVLLPTEDLENPCLTALVGQIFSELIIGNVVANKAAQPWLLYEAICILARLLGEKKARAAERIVSGTHAPVTGISPKTRPRWTVQGFFVAIIHLAILFVTSIRICITALVVSSSLPPRTPSADDTDPVAAHKSVEAGQQRHGTLSPPKVPVLAFSIWSCAANLAELGSRMPWLSGFMSLLQVGAIRGLGQLGGLNGRLDRLLSHYIQSLFSPSHLPPLLRTLRGVLFPNNAPGTPSLFPPASDEELRALRRRAARALWGLLPRGVGRVYFGGRLWRHGVDDGGAEGELMVDELEGLLVVFDDEYCNKHLMYSVLELLLVRLMPEISDKGVVELWDERLA